MKWTRIPEGSAIRRFLLSKVVKTKDEMVDAILALPTHESGMSSVNANIGANFRWNVGNNLTGGAYNQVTNGGNITPSLAFGTTVSNTTSGGGDEVFSFQTGITAGSSATVDLNAMTNLLQQTVVAIVRIKGYMTRVLSAGNDPTISPAPTPTSTATFTNNGPAVPCQLDFGDGGSGLTLTLTQSGGALTGVAIGVAGTGYRPSSSFIVAPNQSTGSGAVVSVTTNSSGVPTSVAVVAAGAGYTNATVPSTLLGAYNVLTGGAHSYFDPSATGFATVSATAKNFRVYNMDATHAITFELDVLAATS